MDCICIENNGTPQKKLPFQSLDFIPKTNLLSVEEFKALCAGVIEQNHGKKVNRCHGFTFDSANSVVATHKTEANKKSECLSLNVAVTWIKKATITTKSSIKTFGRKAIKRSQSLDKCKELFLTTHLHKYENVAAEVGLRKVVQGELGFQDQQQAKSQTFTDWNTRYQNLKDVFDTEECTQAFRKFLIMEFSEENLDFYFDVESYKMQSAAKRRETAEEIYDTYIAIGSLKEINVDFNVKKHTKENLLSPDVTTFDVAQQQIYRLMETDSFQRFSEQFR